MTSSIVFILAYLGLLVAAFLLYLKNRQVRRELHLLRQQIGELKISVDTVGKEAESIQRQVSDLASRLSRIRQNKKLLIIGCGRSGTTYAAEALSRLGLNIGHERDAEDGIASWYMTVDDQPPFDLAPRNHYSFDYIVHQVRNPLHVIASLYTLHPDSWAYICKHLPQIDAADDALLIKAAKYWYYWNLIAEQRARYTYRVEDFEQAAPRIIDQIGIGSFDAQALHQQSKSTNSRPYAKITLAEIARHDQWLFDQVVGLARRYGYRNTEMQLEQLATETAGG